MTRLPFALACVGLAALGAAVAAGGLWLSEWRDEDDQEPWYSDDDQGELAEAILAEKPTWGWAAGCIFPAALSPTAPEVAELIGLRWDRGIGIGVIGDNASGHHLIVVMRKVARPAPDRFQRVEGEGYMCFRPAGPVPELGATA